MVPPTLLPQLYAKGVDPNGSGTIRFVYREESKKEFEVDKSCELV